MLKKIIMILLGITTLTGCGTLMEPARKTIIIHSATPSKMYTDRGGYVGEG